MHVHTLYGLRTPFEIIYDAEIIRNKIVNWEANIKLTCKFNLVTEPSNENFHKSDINDKHKII